MKVLILIGFLLGVSQAHRRRGDDDDECPAGFKQHDDTCYFVSRLEASWASAMVYCQAMKATLATVKSADVQEFLTELIKPDKLSTRVTVRSEGDHSLHFLDNAEKLIEDSSITFEVKACGDAMIILYPNENDNRNAYYVLLAEHGKNSTIVQGPQGVAHNRRGPDVSLHCSEYLPFWISWKDDGIDVGRGHEVGEDTFINWDTPLPYDFNRISVTTGWGNTGDWIFEKSTDMPGNFWIAGSDHAVEGQWVWLQERDEFEYTHWVSGEPDNLYNRQHCVLMNSTQSYQWMDEDCEDKNKFLCQIEDSSRSDR